MALLWKNLGKSLDRFEMPFISVKIPYNIDYKNSVIILNKDAILIRFFPLCDAYLSVFMFLCLRLSAYVSVTDVCYDLFKESSPECSSAECSSTACHSVRR